MAMEKIVKIAPALSGRGDFCFGNLPGKWGVRIEDLVVVTETGVEVLNHFTKDLLVVDK